MRSQQAVATACGEAVNRWQLWLNWDWDDRTPIFHILVSEIEAFWYIDGAESVVKNLKLKSHESVDVENQEKGLLEVKSHESVDGKNREKSLLEMKSHESVDIENRKESFLEMKSIWTWTGQHALYLIFR